MAFWQKEIETMSREQLEEMQLSLIKKKVAEMYELSEFFRGRMQSVGLTPDDIKSFEDFRKIPFMVKNDLRENYPDGLFVRPYDELVRIHVSSGTTGKPTVVGYTRKDLENWSNSLARGMTSIGMTSTDIVQNSHGYGLFTGGLGIHYGSELVGATVLPTSTGNTSRQIQLFQDLPVSVLIGTPSYLFHIVDTCDSMKVSIRDDTRLQRAIAGGEPWSESMRQKFQNRTGIKVFNCYGASEFYGPMFLECEAQDGLHIWSDLCYMEVLDDDGNPVPKGERGQIVVTMLQKEAFPLIRYKIGDISSLDWTPCKCGRTHPRLMRISGRADDMLVVRGVNVFPSQIESVIGEFEELSPFYRITLSNPNYMDEMVVEVEINEDSLKDDTASLSKFSVLVGSRLKDIINIKAEVRLVLPGTLDRFEGKAKHVVDNRKYD